MTHACAVVMYHYVRDVGATAFPRINALAPADFDRQLDWLLATRRVIPYRDFEATVLARRGFEDPTALLTFDDGFVDHHETAFERLRKRGLTGVFFLAGAALADPPALLNVHKTHFALASLGAEAFAAEVRRAVDRAEVAVPAGRLEGVYRYDEGRDVDVKRLLNYELPPDTADRVLDEVFRRHVGEPAAFASRLYLSHEMIREMAAAGMTFGFHTEHHRVLSRLPPSGQRAEVAGGVQAIRRLTGQISVPFCYPYGHRHTYDTTTLEAVADAGYALAFTAVRAAARPEQQGRFELPRLDTRDLPPLSEYKSDA
jgi:peptidoglycan/xylan/chitin deacetylase (PgdA/CDA1 family)